MLYEVITPIELEGRSRRRRGGGRARLAGRRPPAELESRSPVVQSWAAARHDPSEACVLEGCRRTGEPFPRGRAKEETVVKLSERVRQAMDSYNFV